jgi:hypothetical protein
LEKGMLHKIGVVGESKVNLLYSNVGQGYVVEFLVFSGAVAKRLLDWAGGNVIGGVKGLICIEKIKNSICCYRRSSFRSSLSSSSFLIVNLASLLAPFACWYGNGWGV